MVGGSGSGKTWLAEALTGWLGDQAVCLSLDHFYRDLSDQTDSERAMVNFDNPAAIDWDALRVVLETLEKGDVARVPIYDFVEHVRKNESAALASRPFVVLEGLWLLHPEWLRKKFAMSVFVDCPEEVRLSRRVARDRVARGRTEESTRRQFMEHVQPMHARYVEPQRALATRCVTSPATENEIQELKLACLADRAFDP